MDCYRLFFVLRFDLQLDNFVDKRNRLSEISWKIVDAWKSFGFYSQIRTFPRWDSSDEMFDFGWIHDRFPVNGEETLCVHICDSPISDAIDTADFANHKSSGILAMKASWLNSEVQDIFILFSNDSTAEKIYKENTFEGLLEQVCAFSKSPKRINTAFQLGALE